MLTLAESPGVEVRPDIARWAERASACPCVRSVVLFGSRAHGTARHDSDWDVALVVEDGSNVPYDIVAPCEQWAPKHGAVLVAEADMVAKIDTFASLPAEIGAGVLLHGRNYKQRERTMDDKNTLQARSSYQTMTVNMWDSVAREVWKLADAHDNGYVEAQADLGKHSANAAEFVAKLLCLSVGQPFRHAHRLDKLAEDVPREWKDEIAALNGDTHDLHMTSYGDEPIAPADVHGRFMATKSRLVRTLAVVEKLADMPIVASAHDLSRLQKLLHAKQAEFANVMEEAKNAVPDVVEAARRARAALLGRIDRQLSGHDMERRKDAEIGR